MYTENGSLNLHSPGFHGDCGHTALCTALDAIGCSKPVDMLGQYDVAWTAD